MSLKSSRDYLRARAVAVGLREWSDGFNFDNIPSSVINKSFHLSSNLGVGIKNNQIDQEINVEHTIVFFVSGFKNPASAVDSALEIVEDLIKESITPKNRLTQTSGVKNVVFENFNLEASSASNDNLVKASVTFRTFCVLGL